MKKSFILILTLFVALSLNSYKQKWKGKIYTEEGVSVIENKGPGLWGDKINERITFKEDLSLGVEEGEEYLMFYRLWSMDIDSELNLYVLDSGNHRLLKFDREGDFIWKRGRKGQGPGEFQYPFRVAVSPSKEIAVIDSGLIHFFSSEGDYQRSIKFGRSLQNLQFMPDGRLFTNIFVRGQPGIAAEYYSNEGEFLGKFPDEYRYGPKMSPSLGASIGGGFFQLIGKKIYLSLPDQYEIREYDLEGKLLRKIKRNIKLKPPDIRVSPSGRGVSVRDSDSSGPCFFYQGKMLINMVKFVDRKDDRKYETKTFLDFFNEKGQFLGSYRLPDNIRPITLDSESNFYFIQSDPFPRVTRSIMSIN